MSLSQLSVDGYNLRGSASGTIPHVIKRNGVKQEIFFDKITKRIRDMSYELDNVDVIYITKKVINGLYYGITTVELDGLAAEEAISLTVDHYEYDILAARLEVSNLHKETVNLFSDAMMNLYNINILDKEFNDYVQSNKKILNNSIIHNNDYTYTYFGIKTLKKSYLLKSFNSKIIERPQYMLMRVSVGIHYKDSENTINNIIDTYNLLSNGYYIHATPTLFNSGTVKPQLASCFLLPTLPDNVIGIYNTLTKCALISKHAGGIGISIHNIRTTNNGSVVKLLRLYDAMSQHIDQDGKRSGSITVYIEPWHQSIYDFIDAKKNTGVNELRARNLFYALWIPDLFMKRVEANDKWTLFNPIDVNNLHLLYGDEFETKYIQYENANIGSSINARDLWHHIIIAQIETGGPFMLYKDSCIKKSNHNHLNPPPLHSNLCTEIIESTAHGTAVCNLASIALNKFVVDNHFNFDHLTDVVKQIVRNLNKIIDVSYYPIKDAETSNKELRPLGIGVQGLSDTFVLMRYPFESEEARKLNKQIFETIYYTALTESCALAKKMNNIPQPIKDSPMCKYGILQQDMWRCKEGSGQSCYVCNDAVNSIYDWTKLRKRIIKYGTVNSLLIAIMPTASTSQILGNTENIEPCTSNLYIRRTLSGEFKIINKYLIKDLIEHNLWSQTIKDAIIYNDGSIQDIPEIPNTLKQLYKTVWEIKQKKLLDLAIDRSHYIDQSMSLNVYFDKPTYATLNSMHMYGWKHGLKTGMYYLRIKPATSAIKFAVCTNSCLSCTA